jgi:hypothetical protein
MPRRGQHLAVIAERDDAAERARDSRMRRGATEELSGWVAANCDLVALGDRYRRAVDDCEFWLGHTEEDPDGYLGDQGWTVLGRRCAGLNALRPEVLPGCVHGHRLAGACRGGAPHREALAADLEVVGDMVVRAARNMDPNDLGLLDCHFVVSRCCAPAGPYEPDPTVSSGGGRGTGGARGRGWGSEAARGRAGSIVSGTRYALSGALVEFLAQSWKPPRPRRHPLLSPGSGSGDTPCRCRSGVRPGARASDGRCSAATVCRHR